MVYNVFKNGSMILYEGYELPEWLNELYIVDIGGTENEHGECLFFECC